MGNPEQTLSRPLRWRDRTAYKRLVAGAGRLLGAARRRRPGLIILAYHSISEATVSPVTVPPGLFAGQLDWLCTEYPLVPLAVALADPAAEDRVTLTFDDGYSDFLTDALPILRRHAAPATVFVLTHFLQKPSEPFPFAAGAGKRSLSPGELEQLASEELVAIGSHGHRHLRLTRTTAEQLEEELAASKEIVRQAVGYAPEHFAYPWAACDRRVEAAAAAHYTAAVAGRGGKNVAPYRRHRLRRVPVKNESLAMFQARVRGHFLLEDWARELLTRIR